MAPSRLKLLAVALLTIPVAILSFFAIAEMLGGELSGAQHFVQAVPLPILMLVAWWFDPTIILTTLVGGAVYLLGEVVNADFSCSDVTSGIASCVGTVANGAEIDTSTVATKSFSVSAVDNAGNEASAHVSYTVVYDFDGFYQP